MRLSEIIILAAIAFLLLLHFCDKPVAVHSTSSKIDTIFIKSKDPIHQLPTKEYIPYKVEVPGYPYPLPVLIDSDAVVKDYFSRRFYNDSIGNDSVKVYFSANTYKNELRNLNLRYRVLFPTMRIKETKTLNKQLLYLGVDVCSNGQNFGVYTGFYVDLRKGMAGAGYDPINKSIKVGGYFKIPLWNRK